MVWKKDPARVEINQHLHRMHGGYAATGDTLARNVAHEMMHDTPEGWAGKPLHRHVDGALDNIVVDDSEDNEE